MDNQYLILVISIQKKIYYSNSILDSTTILNGNNNSWTGYKMKINGVHYYPSQQTQKYETNISSSRSNTSSTTNYFLENSSTDFSS